MTTAARVRQLLAGVSIFSYDVTWATSRLGKAHSFVLRTNGGRVVRGSTFRSFVRAVNRKLGKTPTPL